MCQGVEVDLIQVNFITHILNVSNIFHETLINEETIFVFIFLLY